MIFRAAMLAKVLDGSKTVTRRPAKLATVLGPALPCRYVKGRDYAIQPGRGQRAVARLRVAAVALEPLFHITDVDALLEGFGDRDEFLAYWREVYGRVRFSEPVWRIAFDLMASDPSGTPPPDPTP